MKNYNLMGINDTSSPAENATMKIFGLMENITNQTETFSEITEDLGYATLLMVNVCFFGKPNNQTNEWTLIDCGLPNSAEVIHEIAEKRFGKNTKPKTIILTHGHFDHVGSIVELLKKWDVAVYAHELELPYLTGQKDYPSGNPSVDNGLMSKLSPLYPNEGINLGEYVKPLPSDGSVPGMSGWRWIHTPGHTAGHISLFRDDDHTLIVGDAFTTVRQESAMAVLAQKKKINGPPAYFTFDWRSAWESIKILKSLNPYIAITGHGKPMYNEELSSQLDELSIHLEQYVNLNPKNHLN